MKEFLFRLLSERVSMKPLRVLLLLSLFGVSPVAAAEPERKVTPVPAERSDALKLAPFYKKHVDLKGFSIVGSEKVSDKAMLEAALIVEQMLADREDILK